MAWGTRGAATAASRSAKPGSATFVTTCSGASTPQAGDVHVVVLAKDNGFPTSGATDEWTGVTDSGGNTYIKIREWTNAQGTASAGAVCAVFYSLITTSLIAGTSTITASSVSVGLGAMAISTYGFTCRPGAVIAVAAVTNNAAAAGGNIPVITLSGLTNREYLFIQAVASESSTWPQAITPWVDWNKVGTSGGSSVTNIGLDAAHRILTGTTVSTSFNALSADHAEILFALTEDPSGPLATVEQTCAGATVSAAGTVVDPPPITGPTGSPILDNFNRADEIPLTNPWISGGASVRLVNQRFTTASSTVVPAWAWLTTSFSGSFETFLRIARLGEGEHVELFLCTSAGAYSNSYSVRVAVISGVCYLTLRVYVSSSSTDLDAGMVNLGALPSAIAFRRDGTQVRAYARVSGVWTLISSATETTHTGPLYTEIDLFANGYAQAPALDDYGGASDVTGPPERIATVTQTLVGATVAGAGTVTGVYTPPRSAVVTQTLAGATASATGTIPAARSAALALTLAGTLVSGVATATANANLGQTLASASVSAASTVDSHATLTQTALGVTLAASGLVLNPALASLNQSLGALTTAATAAVPASGSAAFTFGALTGVATGHVEWLPVWRQRGGYTNRGGGGESSAVQIVMPSAPILGNALIVLIHGYGFNGALSFQTPSDQYGNTYVAGAPLVQASGDTRYATQSWICEKITGTGPGLQVVVLGAGGGALDATIAGVVIEYTLPVAGSSLVRTAYATNAPGSSTSLSTGATASVSGTAVLAMQFVRNRTSPTASITVESVSPAWLQEFESLNAAGGTNAVAGEGDSRVVTGLAGTVTGAWTQATAGDYAAGLVVLQVSTPISAIANQTLGSLAAVGTATIPTTVALNASLGAATAVATATVPRIASLSQSLADLTCSGTAIVLNNPSSVLSQTLGAATAVGTATVPRAATLVQNLGLLTASGTAAVSATSSLVQTLSLLTGSGTASVSRSATLTKTLDTLSASGTATVPRASTLTQTLEPLTVVATGAVVSGPSGFVFATLGALSGSGTAVVSAPSASLNRTLGMLTSTATSAVSVSGALTQSLGPLTSNGTSGAAISGTLSRTLGTLTGSATGAIAIRGTLTQNLGALTLSGTGAVTSGAKTASLDQTLGALTCSGTASVTPQRLATLAQTLGAATLVATATTAVTGTASPLLGTLTGSGLSTVAVRSALVQTLGWLTLTTDADVEVTAVLQTSLGLLTASAAGTNLEVGFATDGGSLSGDRGSARVDTDEDRTFVEGPDAEPQTQLQTSEIVRLVRGPSARKVA